jgi:cell division protein FtsN
MAKSTSRKTGRSGGSSIFTGVLIGLIVGAVLSVGVALWVTGNNPFKLAEPAKSTPPSPSAKPATAPNFDFYSVLPGNTPNTPPTPDTSAVTPAKPTLYYLQAGAFQNPAEADNLKARLALLGVETAIQTLELGDKGVLHRVRVGPFRALDEVNRTRSLLTQNNIPVTLVKEVPTPQEKP